MRGFGEDRAGNQSTFYEELLGSRLSIAISSGISLTNIGCESVNKVVGRARDIICATNGAEFDIVEVAVDCVVSPNLEDQR